MEWTSTAIQIWFFPRNAIPESISSGSPDVNTFGIPAANFEGNCDIDAHFYNHSMIFNIDFCGSYAGNVWENNGCPMLDPENGWSSCSEFVALNPSAFAETYWEVNYLNVYQAATDTTHTSTSSLSSVTPAISTSTAASTALSGAMGRTTTHTMSLAGTTPTITTGFSATGSVLSVLSSLSTESEASASSVSSRLVGRATSTSFPSSASSSGLPFSTTPTFTSVFTSTPIPVSSSISSVETPSSQTSSAETPAPCTGTVCTSNVFITVVQTITVGGIAQRRAPTSTVPQHAVQIAHDWDRFDLCNFEILPAARPKNRWTDFACTLTREEVLNGQLITETIVASTAVQSNTALQFGELLVIDEIVVETRGVANLTHSRKHTFTGSFTPSGTSFSSTRITACPESLVTATEPTLSVKLPNRVTPTLQNDQSFNYAAPVNAFGREELVATSGSIIQTYTSYITVSKVEATPSSTLSQSTGNAQSGAACSGVPLGLLFGLSLLAAIRVVI